jgi:hypothetical protein
VHHIAVAVPQFDETLAMLAKRGNDVVLSSEFSGIRVVYLGTDRDLGVTIEISDMRDTPQKPYAR